MSPRWGGFGSGGLGLVWFGWSRQRWLGGLRWGLHIRGSGGVVDFWCRGCFGFVDGFRARGKDMSSLGRVHLRGWRTGSQTGRGAGETKEVDRQPSRRRS